MSCPRSTRASRGFSLVEAAVALCVLALLATVALPSLREPLHKSRRADAVARLQQLQQAQERWRADHVAYTPSLSDLGLAATPPGAHYTLALTAADAVGYVATATAQGRAQAGDQRCRVLKLTQTGGRTAYSSIDGGFVEHHDADRCWSR